MNTIVVPVNCVGVAGTGLALTWARLYPDIVREYKLDCAQNLLGPGRIVDYGRTLAVATKDHWQNPSRVEWIETGLLRIALYVAKTKRTVAVPALGCGNGSLSWSRDVKPLIDEILSPYDDVEVYIPGGR